MRRFFEWAPIWLAFIVIGIVVALLVWSLFGRRADGQRIVGPHFSIETVHGVQCVVYSAPYKGGISCNWEKYNQEHP